MACHGQAVEIQLHCSIVSPYRAFHELPDCICVSSRVHHDFPSFFLSGVIPATPIWENWGKVTPVSENLFGTPQDCLHSSPLFIPRILICKNSGKVTPVSGIFSLWIPVRLSPFLAVNDTPHPPMYNSGQVTPPPEIFFRTRIVVVFSPHCLMSKIVLFGNLWRKFF